MRAYRFDHLGDTQLLYLLAELVAKGRENDAKIVAVIAEVDRRRLYLPAGYTSMKTYCIETLGLSEDAAFKRLQVARAVDEFPVVLEMLADGRLHLTGARMVVPHLTSENAVDLLTAVTFKTKAEIEQLLRERFSDPDLLTVDRRSLEDELAPGQVDPLVAGADFLPAVSTDPPKPQLAPGQVAPERRVNLAPRRVPLDLLPVSHDRIRDAKELLGHELPSGDDALVVDRALAEMVARLRKRKSGVCRTRRCQTPPSDNPRHIPKRVKAAIWERDGAQCTFVGNTGHRCATRKYLEFDHIEPVARGGTSTVENLRLRCGAHNQFEAERTFGKGFMEQRRQVSRISREKTRDDETDSLESRFRAAAAERTRDIVAGLRGLGLRVDQARRAAEYSSTLKDLSLAEQMRAALQFHGTRVS